MARTTGGAAGAGSAGEDSDGSRDSDGSKDSDTQKRDSWQRVVQIMFCGGVAGTVAKTAIAPFDRVKIHFQVQNPLLAMHSGRIGGVFDALRFVHRTTGVAGLYRGHSAMLLRIFPYAAINYAVYERAQRWLYQGKPAAEVWWWWRLLAGSLAGAAAVTCTYPLDIVRARLAFDLSSRPPARHPKKYFFSLRAVLSELAGEGRRAGGGSVAGFYQGYLPTLAGILPYAGVSFFSFERQKMLYRRWTGVGDDAPVPVLAKLPMGMLSGALAQTAAYPLDVIRRRAQVLRVAPHLVDPRLRSHPSPHSHPHAPIMHILGGILREKGLRGLFVGLSINYLKVAPATGISFVVYEFLRERILHQHHHHQC